MRVGDIRDALASLDGRLDDVRRHHAWSRIEHAIAEPPPARSSARGWWLAVATAAVAACVLWLVVRAASTPRDGATTVPMIATPGHPATIERAGLTLVLHGPGIAMVRERDAALSVVVIGGTLVAERHSGSRALAIEAGGNATLTRDARVAVHVEPGLVVLGAGERSKVIVERFASDAVGAATVAPPAAVSPPPDAAAPPPTTTAASPPPRRIRPPARSNELAPAVAADADEADDDEADAHAVVDARALYHDAEVALSAHDRAAARRLLEQLLRDFPRDKLVDAARFDLALIANADGDHARAGALLDELIAGAADPNVRDAAKRLRAASAAH